MPPKRAVKKVRKAPRVGQRRIKNGKEQIYMIQGGRGFWSDAWKWVKNKAAPAVFDVLKKSKVGSQLVRQLPGPIGAIGGDLAEQAGFGYGQRGAGGRFVSPGNALQAM